MLAFDTETTATDPFEARVVQVCLARCQPHQPNEITTWLLDPGVEIPAEAAAIHGITTEVARRDGATPAPVLDEVADRLVAAWTDGVPAIIMNASYDLTVLDAELARHGLPVLHDRLRDTRMLIVDPLVIDRHVARYRPGKKRLEDLCRTYAVPLEDAHQADADAVATARVAWRLAEAFPEQLGDLQALQELQQAWHLAWATDFEEYMREHVDPETTIERTWPHLPQPAS